MKLKANDTFENWFCVDDSVYNGFINTFNDTNIIHTNDNYAVAKGFKKKVMHGNILCGFLSYFIGQVLPVKNTIIHFQLIKFHNPVYLYDKLLLKASVVEIFESVRCAEIKFTFNNLENIKVASGKIQIGLI